MVVRGARATFSWISMARSTWQDQHGKIDIERSAWKRSPNIYDPAGTWLAAAGAGCSPNAISPTPGRTTLTVPAVVRSHRPRSPGHQLVLHFLLRIPMEPECI